MLNPDKPLERYAAPLRAIPANDRENYIKVGMALHFEGGGSDEARDMWRDWAMTSDKFNPGDFETDWLSFKPKPGGVTGGTIISLGMQYGYRPDPNGSTSPPPRPSSAAGNPKETKLWSDVEGGLLRAGYNQTAVYDYRDSFGALVAQKIRFEHPSPGPGQKAKTFVWRSAQGDRLVARRGEGPCPPYALPRLLEHADEAVWVVEGEKDANRLNGLGLVSISIESGSEKEAAEFLAGRVVWVIPDNDAEGEKRAKRVFEKLSPVAERVHIVRLDAVVAKGDVSDWLDGGRSLSDLLRLCDDTVVEDANRRLAGITWHKDIGLSPAARYLIDEVIPSEGIGFLWGDSYVGKSFVAHAMGMSIARGVPFADKYETEQGVVIYIAIEAEASIRDRHCAYTAEHDVSGEVSFGLLSCPLDLCDSISVSGLIQKLKAVRELKGAVRLVIIDTLSKAMAGRDETKDMPLAIRHMELIQKETCGAVMAVHHAGKDRSAGMRGGSAAFAGADFVLRIDGGPTKEVRTLHREKIKNGEPIDLASYRIDGRNFGTDARGKPINIGVAVWLDAELKKKQTAITPAHEALIEHVRQLVIRQDGSIMTPHADGYPHRPLPAVRIEELVQRAIKGEDVSVKAASANKPKIILQMLNKLKRRGILGLFDGLAWIVKDEV